MQKQKLDKILVASKILSMSDLSEPGFDKNLSPEEEEARRIISELAKKHGGVANKQDVFLKAIEIIGKPTTQRERAIIANIYNSCPVEYTLYAIKATEDYIAHGFYFPVIPKIKTYKPGFTNDMLNLEKIANWYYMLGKLYERCYEFDKAIEAYDTGGKYDFWSHFPYLYKSMAYVKKNDLGSAINILREAQKHPNYAGDEENNYFYSDVIDNFLTDTLKKKEKGYIYKPRGHREFLPIPEK